MNRSVREREREYGEEEGEGNPRKRVTCKIEMNERESERDSEILCGAARSACGEWGLVYEGASTREKEKAIVSRERIGEMRSNPYRLFPCGRWILIL